MLAVQFPALDHLIVTELPRPVPTPGEVVVQLRAAALNHRDLWIKVGKYAGLKWPIIPGSDGAGVIADRNGVAGQFAEGDEVIINPGFDWGSNERSQSRSFSILGLPRDGTLAQFVAVPMAQIARKPTHLDWYEAAALPLAGLTAYRAVFSRADLKPGEKVLINGVGGGVALLAMQYAIAHGAEVWVTSSHPAKLDRAVALGAKGGFDYNEKGWTKKAQEQVGGFDVIIESAGGTGFERLIDVAAFGGRIVFFGATRGDPLSLPMRKVFWKQLSLLGTTMGSPADWQAMVAFVAANQIRPVVSDVFPLSAAAQAFAVMANGDQFGKVVLTLPD